MAHRMLSCSCSIAKPNHNSVNCTEPTVAILILGVIKYLYQTMLKIVVKANKMPKYLIAELTAELDFELTAELDVRY